MSDIDKAINEIMDYIDEIKEEKQRQQKMLDILKENAYIYRVNENIKTIQITITTCDNNYNLVEEWLNDKQRTIKKNR